MSIKWGIRRFTRGGSALDLGCRDVRVNRHQTAAGSGAPPGSVFPSEKGLTRDQELWACALAIERQHGSGAFLYAAMEIDRLDGEGEGEAAKVWREVLRRLVALESERGSGDARLAH